MQYRRKEMSKRVLLTVWLSSAAIALAIASGAVAQTTSLQQNNAACSGNGLSTAANGTTGKGNCLGGETMPGVTTTQGSGATTGTGANGGTMVNGNTGAQNSTVLSGASNQQNSTGYGGGNVTTGSASSSGQNMMNTMTAEKSSKDVRKIQQALNQNGLRVKVDGKWGPKTKEALREFQQKNGLQASGRLDSQTLQKLQIGG
jgi:hypothetical protein